MANFFKDIGQKYINVFKGAGQAMIGKDTGDEARQIADQKQQEMWNALKSGQAEGKARAEKLYGSSENEIGGMTKDITQRTEEQTRRYSGEGDLIKRKGNVAAKVAKLRGGKSGAGTGAEGEQISRNMATDTAMNRYKEQTQAMNNYRSLVGNLARNMASSEMGQGQLNLMALRPLSDAEMPRQQGILADMFG